MRETPEMRGLRLSQQGGIERAFKRQKLRDEGLLPIKTEVTEMVDYQDDEFEHLSDGEVLDLWSEQYRDQSKFAQRVMKAQRNQELRNIKSDPRLMARLEDAGMTPEEYHARIHSQEGQRAYAEVYEEGFNRFMDKVLPETKQQEAQPGSQKPKPQSRVPYARELDQATERRTGKDSDLEAT